MWYKPHTEIYLTLFNDCVSLVCLKAKLASLLLPDSSDLCPFLIRQNGIVLVMASCVSRMWCLLMMPKSIISGNSEFKFWKCWVSFSSALLWVFYLLEHAHFIWDWTKRCCGSQLSHLCYSDLKQWNPAKHVRSPPHLQILPHQKGMLQMEHLACLFAGDALTVTFRSLASHNIYRSPDMLLILHFTLSCLHTNLVVLKWIVLTLRVWNKSIWYDWLYSNLTSLGNLFLNYQELKFTQ